MPKTFDANETALELVNAINGPHEGKSPGIAYAKQLDELRALLQAHYNELSDKNKKIALNCWLDNVCSRKEGNGDIFAELFQYIRIDLAKMALGLPQDPMDFKLADRLQTIIACDQFGACSFQLQRWLAKEYHYVTEYFISEDSKEDCSTNSDLLKFASWLTDEKESDLD